MVCSDSITKKSLDDKLQLILYSSLFAKSAARKEKRTQNQTYKQAHKAEHRRQAIKAYVSATRLE